MHTLLIKGNLWQHSMQKPQAISHHTPDNCISRHALDNHNFTQHAFRNISSCYLKGGNCKVVTDKNFFHVARLGIVASYRTIPRTRVHFNRLEKIQSNVQKFSQVSSTPKFISLFEYYIIYQPIKYSHRYF